MKAQIDSARAYEPACSGPTAPIVVRKGGVYLLPDGNTVVAGVVSEGGRCFLFHPLVWRGSRWIVNMPIAFEIMEGGKILTGKGEATPWHTAELRDTDQNAESR